MGNTCLLFKNINQKIYKVLKENREFFLWILILLSIDYLLLFALEITLPGLVIENFNLNILLIVVLLGWFGVLNYYDIKKSDFKNFNKLIGWCFLFFLLLAGWLVLFNIVFWEFLIVVGLLFLIGFYFMKIN
jgi:hypothetical protein